MAPMPRCGVESPIGKAQAWPLKDVPLDPYLPAGLLGSVGLSHQLAAGAPDERGNTENAESAFIYNRSESTYHPTIPPGAKEGPRYAPMQHLLLCPACAATHRLPRVCHRPGKQQRTSPNSLDIPSTRKQRVDTAGGVPPELRKTPAS